MRRDHRWIIKVLIGFYLISSLLIIEALTVKGGSGLSNIHLYSLSCVLSSICISAYFYSILNRPIQKLVVVVASLTNIVYYLVNNIIARSPKVFDSLAYVILSSTVVIFVFMFMYQLLNEVKEEPLSLNFDFWFVSSQLFYFLGAFAIFLTYGYLTNRLLDNNITINYAMAWLWGFHNVLLFLSALITSGSIVWISYRSKSPSSW